MAADLRVADRAHRKSSGVLAELIHLSEVVNVVDENLGPGEGGLRRPGVSMDCVEGPDAAELLGTRFPAGMPRAEAVEIVAAVAETLNYAATTDCCTTTSNRPTSCSPTLMTRGSSESC